jgi:predicted ATP-dependent serine protease
VGHLARRLGEAARLGFARALVPHGAAASVSAAGLRIEPIASVVDALRVTGVLGK